MAAVLKLREQANGRPILRGHEHFWSVILDLTRAGETFTLKDVASGCNDRTDSSVTDYVRRLTVAGYLDTVGQTDEGRYSKPIYKLIKRQAEAPRLRRDGTELPPPAQQLMWNTMRNLLKGGFCARELAQFASIDEVTVPLVTAKSYLKHLDSAGYLHCLEPGRGRHLARWRLKPSMNTGPKAPKILRTQAVYDPNLNEIPGTADAEEVQP
ncbi:hypothetical protein C8N35_102102 [Breoghania corrubedonensis]|uniref:Uncharacterized protein n=1 Tax=Breoghania corrubedonensis TaxID=665038 RepID=A0A2T5VCA5_9HYPH|nr:hypothetical protein [Breoghania corrubedonensis]PTW61393.1 hypothetical protein C8N35_102102 [Breoghania corrubedonensis]